MNLLQMSFSGALIILVTVVIRAVAINRLPKKIFLILWGIVLLRLLIPFSIPSTFSIYSAVEKNIPDNIVANTSEDNITPAEPQQINENKLDEIQYLQGDNVPFSALPVIWFIGMATCTIDLRHFLPGYFNAEKNRLARYKTFKVCSFT